MPKPTSAPTITVSPESAAVGQDVTITVTGLSGSAYLNIDVTDEQSTTAYPVGHAVDGRVTCSHHCYWPGTSRVEVRDVDHAHPKVLATATFEVTPTS